MQIGLHTIYSHSTGGATSLFSDYAEFKLSEHAMEQL